MFTYRKVGGDTIATGTLQIHATCGLGPFNILNAILRITTKYNNVLAYEDFFMTKEDGKAPKIPLYVDETQTAGYEIDIHIKHSHAAHIALSLYLGVHSELIVYVMPKLHIQTQSML